jgi:spore germination cell wall hydrolase CwlJ-like protein
MARRLEELDDLEVMALTVWGEARGEGVEGQAAVAWVIRNRARWPRRSWWGGDIRSVCLKRWQFSAWNAQDPNREKMLDLCPDDPALAAVREICRKVLAGAIPDPTRGCTHYCTHASRPAWKRGRDPKTTVGRHAFYQIGPGA